MRRVEGPANHLLGNSSQGLFEGWILELIRGIEETRLTFVCTELKAAASSPLTRERVRVQVWPLESQTASLQPQCEALIMSKYRQRFLHLACRILSEPCESAPCDGSQLKAPTRDVSLFVRYLFAVCIKALGSPSSSPRSIMTTLFSASSGKELGREKCGKGEATKLRSRSWNCALY